MKRLLRCTSCALALCSSLHAAEPVLRIDLPQVELMLAPVSAPQLQREGQPLPGELNMLREMLEAIEARDYEAALARFGDEHEEELLLLEQGDPEGQLKERAVAGDFGARPSRPLSATLLYIVGHTYMTLRQDVPAETAFRTALEAVPDFVRVHEALAMMYLQAERYEEARVHVVRGAELGLNSANLHGTLGYLNRQTGNYWGAVAAFQQALMLEPGNPGFEFGLLNALAETYQHQSGLTLVEEMLRRYPDETPLWLFRSQFALQAGEKTAALSSLETAIRLGEDSVANLQVCATLHMELGSLARAVDLLSSGAAAGMEFRFVDQALAWLIQKEEWDYTQRLLEGIDTSGATLDDNEQSRLLTRQASLSLHNDAGAEARTALQRALELDPGNADALMSLAGIHRDARNFNQAELLYQRASAYDLYRESALIALAQLAIDQDNFARALDLLREVVARNPARSDLYRNIESLESLVLLQTGN